ncbi:hypothetical protein NDU88_000845 [Pleurodeles waltl]|uniref:Uncharacterized protein n=1 Tax=Pleurodeles waltl TaxID=8319 RepID=A0AAV7P9G0_PLEWA|nr:hypothetical protein NDU88_000845 [Pleurodeles waltl]
MASRAEGARVWRLYGKEAAGSVCYLLEEAAVGGAASHAVNSVRVNFQVLGITSKRSRWAFAVGVWAVLVCALRRSVSQSRDACGRTRPALCAGQQTARTTGLRQRVLTSCQLRLSPCAGSDERGSRSAGLGDPRGRRRPRRCIFFFP